MSAFGGEQRTSRKPPKMSACASMERFDLYPARLMGDSAYGSAEMIGWLGYEHGIEPQVAGFDKSERQDGTFSRDDFTYDHASDVYVCPGSKLLTTTGALNDGATLRYRASKYDCQACRLKPRCCPKEPARYVPRSIYEGARDMAREIARSWKGRVSRRLRKKIEMLFAHLKRILKLDRLRLRGPNGARDEFTLAATAQNLRKLPKRTRIPTRGPERTGKRQCTRHYNQLLPGFFNRIGHLRRFSRGSAR